MESDSISWTHINSTKFAKKKSDRRTVPLMIHLEGQSPLVFFFSGTGVLCFEMGWRKREQETEEEENKLMTTLNWESKWLIVFDVLYVYVCVRPCSTDNSVGLGKYFRWKVEGWTTLTSPPLPNAAAYNRRIRCFIVCDSFFFICFNFNAS